MSVQGFNFGNGVEKYDFESLDNTPELALQDGNYPDMTVGNADQLTSSMYVEDSVPYLYRTSGGTADIGNREELEIVGGSVVWNQLINTSDNTRTNGGLTITRSNGCRIDYSGTATESNYVDAYAYTGADAFLNNFQVGHKYLLMAVSSDNRAYITVNNPYTDASSGTVRSRIYTPTATPTYFYVRIKIELDAVISGHAYINVFDLTAMFGSTIADYIYTLEQTTEGAGIAKLKSWGFFTKDYYPYSEPDMQSVEGLVSHDMVGFNQWDEEWENGSYNADGQPIEDGTRIRTKNHIPVIGGAKYWMKSPSTLGIRYYDKNDVFISDGYITTVNNGESTPPANARYLRFSVVDIATYKNDICINLSWSGYRNGEYEPYVKHSYPLDSSLTLRGIPKKDADGNLYYDGDVYKADGTVERNYKEMTLNGSESWVKETVDAGNYKRFYFEDDTIKRLLNYTNIFINDKGIPSRTGHTETDDVGDMAFSAYNAVSTYNPGKNWFYILSKTITTVADLKTWLASNPITVLCPLATPTTETADPFQSPQIVNDFGTEEFVTDSIVPVGHNTKYPANLRDKLQHLPSQTGTDGYYAIHEDDGQMTLSPLPAEIPSAPSMDGTYVLKATVSSGTVTLTWDAE